MLMVDDKVDVEYRLILQGVGGTIFSAYGA